jgi:uridine phosphorylase
MSKEAPAPAVQHLPIGPDEVAGNGDKGRLFFLPGSDARARLLAERFEDRREIPSPRQHNVFLGSLRDGAVSIDVGTVATGIGCPSLNIVVTELIMLGARRFIRVGTCGSLRPDTVRAGHLVIATGAVRDERTSDRYIGRGYPAIADPTMFRALRRAALKTGNGDRTFAGLIHAKDALYALEFGHGARSELNEAYVERLRQMRVFATDMEASHLFVLSDAHSRDIVPLTGQPSPKGAVRSGVIDAVVGDDAPYAEPEIAKEAEGAAVEVALAAAFEIFAEEAGE